MILVTAVNLPAYQTIGIVTGIRDDGMEVDVAVDHRPCRAIYDALMSGEEVNIDPEDYLVLSVRDPKEPEYTPARAVVIRGQAHNIDLK